jgi:alpha-amylase
MADFIKTTRSETGKPNLFALGEFWKDSFDDLSNYVDALGTQVRFVPSFLLCL